MQSSVPQMRRNHQEVRTNNSGEAKKNEIITVCYLVSRRIDGNFSGATGKCLIMDSSLLKHLLFSQFQLKIFYSRNTDMNTNFRLDFLFHESPQQKRALSH